VRSGEARLACRTSGTGTPVVLVHAGIADSRMWDALVPRLAADHTVVRYDLRGYGGSSLPPGEFSHVEDLAAVVAATTQGPVHLVGASLGGRVALDLALDRPDLVRSLTLLGAVVSGFEPDTEPPALWDELGTAHRADDLDALADVEARMWLADPDGTRLPGGVLDLVRDMNRIALRNERSGVAEEREPPMPAVDRLAGLARPVLVVVGVLDLPDIRLAADLLAERVRGAERVDLAGVAHLPALERPDEVSVLLRRFLDRVDGGR
jgi:pimeloyl-ACP methyl ester carboxylesterase